MSKEDDDIIYETIWNGGPLLPEREEQENPVWDELAMAARAKLRRINKGLYRINDRDSKILGSGE